MNTRPGGSPTTSRFALLRDRLTFANLTALLALFVALGGTSYAALSVGSEQIANNSVRSEDLRNNDVRGRDIHKDTVRGTDVRDGDLQGRDVRDNTITGTDVKESALGTVPSAHDAQMFAGKPASAFLGSDKQLRVGPIKLAQGETKTVATSGPFTWTAACSDDPGGNTRLIVTVESTEPDGFIADFGGGGQPVSPGSPAEAFNSVSSGSVYTIGFPFSAVGPSGAAPAGIAFVGIKIGGADCLVNGIIWP